MTSLTTTFVTQLCYMQECTAVNQLSYIQACSSSNGQTCSGNGVSLQHSDSAAFLTVIFQLHDSVKYAIYKAITISI